MPAKGRIIQAPASAKPTAISEECAKSSTHSNRFWCQSAERLGRRMMSR
jgi:hypothetical protein